MQSSQTGLYQYICFAVANQQIQFFAGADCFVSKITDDVVGQNQLDIFQV